jgi:succinate-semialdehyde dehydrogenase/glutarate-semialdehyde dehydrogenase
VSETSVQALVAHLPTNSDTVPVLNPANGKKIYDLPQLSVAQVEAAIDAARDAQHDWAKTPVAERSKLLLELHALMLEDETKLLDLLQLETAKSRAHAFEETAGAIAAASYYLSLIHI